MEYLPGGVHGETSKTSKEQGCFAVLDLPADGGIWYFVDINKKV